MDQPVRPDPRLERLYEGLRERLLDLSRRNPMLNYRMLPRSKRQLAVVDEVPEEVLRRLAVEGASLDVNALPEPPDTPADERTEEFQAALDHARVADLEHLTRLEALDATAREDEAELAKLDRLLRDKVRADLGLKPRPDRKALDLAAHARAHGIDPSIDLPAARSRDGHQDRRLQTLLLADELEARLEKIVDAGRLAEQEMGLSTLFIAFGFLEWFETESAEKPSFAPLLLLPVQLEAKRVRGRRVFALAAAGEGADANPTLQRFLERSFNRRLPDFAPEEDEAAPVERYFEAVAVAVEGLKRWRVRRFLVLGHFAFGRLAMYEDLAAERWAAPPAAHPLVGALLAGADGGEPALPAVPEDYAIDDPAIEAVAPALIQDADASQHSAVVDAMKGANLVIQGPPGTGKSQTIANIIANALREGRRVLFMAEKLAALEVVKRRLDAAGLGPFCLELHSHKISAAAVVASLKERAALLPDRAAPPLDRKAWEEARRDLNAYAEALHRPEPDGATAFELIWASIAGRDRLGSRSEPLDAPWPAALLDDPAESAEALRQIALFADAARVFEERFGPLAASPWWRLAFEGTKPFAAREIARLVEEIAAAARALATEASSLADGSNADRAELAALAEALRALPPIEDAAGLDVLARLDPAGVAAALADRRTVLASPADLRLSLLDGPALAVAMALKEAPADWAARPARELFGEAPTLIERAGRLLPALQACAPALQLLGLDDRTALESLRALWTTAAFAAALDPALRSWMPWSPPAGEAAFAAAREVWAGLAAAEEAWRERAPGYDPRHRPPSSKLQASAEALSAGGVARLFAGLTGRLRQPEAVAASLGLDDPAALAALAAHVAAVEAFEGNRAFAAAVGPVWAGLATPFDVLQAVLQARGLLLNRVGAEPGGPAIEVALRRLQPDALAALALEAPRLKEALALVEGEPALRPLSLAEALDRLWSERQAGEHLAALAASGRLGETKLTVAELAAGAAREAERRAAQGRLAAHPAGPLVSSAVTVGALDRLAALAAYAAAVGARPWPASVGAALLGPAAPAARGELAGRAERILAAEGRLAAALGALATEHGLHGLPEAEPSALADAAEALARRRPEIADMVQLKALQAPLLAKGLGGAFAMLDEGRIPAGSLAEGARLGLARARAERLRRSGILADSSGLVIEARRRRFAVDDRAKIEADRAAIRATLLKARPEPGFNHGPRRSWTEMALLRNEFGKERRFVPVRALLARAPRSVQALKPCFMMSPLSLAKALPREGLEFDLLVIDEASQMRPEDALGGLLRARQIVVVGDTKQLPPTNFFTRTLTAEEGAPEEEELEDLDDESILEGCLKTFRSVRALKWHYRSRCESLIAFSNRHFYGDALITFPTAEPGSFSVELVRVDGLYKARRNAAEAQRVAEEAVELMRQEAGKPEGERASLGLVAVNIEQRELIAEELRRLSAGDEAVERYREAARARGEDVFIKNLENVQGDERDVIFISLTYGPAEPGAPVLQRFGPIGGRQGHRRLNVLFTRARRRVRLFASMGSADVRPSETSSRGVHILKAYLDYAERRQPTAAGASVAEPESDFELAVKRRLEARGYRVDAQIGASGYRIDLAVRDPDSEGRYLAGIECDGARYHASRSARDRDRLREEVLARLGWRLLRVWSTDWFEDAEGEAERLSAAIEALRTREQPPIVHPEAPAHRSGVGESRNPEPTGEGGDPSAGPEPKPDSAPRSDGAAGSGLELHDGADQPASASVEAPPAIPGRRERAAALTVEEARMALEELRRSAVERDFPGAEPQRSILRPPMIERMLNMRLDDPADFHAKIPAPMRAGTDPRQIRYLPEICAIIERIA